MRRSGCLTAFLAVACCWGQPAVDNNAPRFEVVSVRIATETRDRTEWSWGESTGRVTLRWINLRMLIERAFSLRHGQMSAPAWIDDVLYDVLAAVPAGAPKEDIPRMFQTLLAERFGLRYHRESQEMGAYALVVDKGGPNLGPALPDLGEPLSRTNRPGSGESQLPSGRGKGAFEVFELAMTKDGGLHFNFPSMTMQNLAAYLSQGQLDLPVVDMTELKGAYLVELDIAVADLSPARGGTSIASGNDPGQLARGASDPSGQSIHTSLKKLGLRLERRKLPSERFVIDQIERTPTAN